MSALEPGTSSARPARASDAPRDLLLWEVREHFPARRSKAVELSLVAPVFEEEDNLERLLARVIEIFGTKTSWELLLVDDGSKDRSPALIRELAQRDPRVVGVFFARNRGQTAATAAGVHLARGRLIATLDADLQNDPADLPAMIAMIEGHDAVVGWRMKRRDTFVRRASSKIANGIRNWISKDSIRDTGCSLKVFRAEAIQAIPLFEGMHRFLPTLMRYHGFSVLEHGVGHHPRTAGKSKYGVWNRAFRALKDLFAVRWMRARLLRLPIREVSDVR
ncbi:MAG: glycosyltransferase family 2 protein [Planctomycetes bacterium]|nr:glycosyltransferase family 2 protein [Planctomycetota bacterium]